VSLPIVYKTGSSHPQPIFLSPSSTNALKHQDILHTQASLNKTHSSHTPSTIMDTIKNAGNYVSDKIQGTAHGTSKEANKEVAKDSNVGVGDR